MIFNKKMDLKNFIITISEYQRLYWELDKELDKYNISASESIKIHNKKNRIAEDIARFILDKNITVEIINRELLEYKQCK